MMQAKIFSEIQHSFNEQIINEKSPEIYPFQVTSNELLLYIHIPFCKSICKNSKFTRITDISLIDNYVNALIKDIEIRLVNSNLEGKRVRACYIGGGTPSLLSPQALKLIIRTLKKYYPF